MPSGYRSIQAVLADVCGDCFRHPVSEAPAVARPAAEIRARDGQRCRVVEHGSVRAAEGGQAKLVEHLLGRRRLGLEVGAGARHDHQPRETGDLARLAPVQEVEEGPRRRSSTSETAKRGCARTASSVIRNRCSADVSSAAGLWGGTAAGTKSTRSKARASQISSARSRWPKWIGLKEPPKTPTLGTGAATPAPDRHPSG